MQKISSPLGVYFHIFSDDIESASSLSGAIPPDSFWKTLNDGAEPSSPVRPSSISPLHFIRAQLQELFAAHQALRLNHSGYSAQARLVLFHQKFRQDQRQRYWPWSCWFSFEYDECPLAFRVMSTSREVLSAPEVTPQFRIEHLTEVLLPILSQGSLAMTVPRKNHSETRLALSSLFGSLFSEFNWVTAKGHALSMYLIARSEEEQKRLFSRDRREDWIRLDRAWAVNPELNLEESLYGFPEFFFAEKRADAVSI